MQASEADVDIVAAELSEDDGDDDEDGLVSTLPFHNPHSFIRPP